MNIKRRQWIRTLIVSGSETLLAVGLVFVFALMFMAAFRFLVPSGTGLVSFYGDAAERGGARRGRTTASEGGEEDQGASSAILASVTRRVKDRPAEAVAWETSTKGMRIHNGHAIQTLEGSAASILVDARDEIRMGENSLVVFKTRGEETGEDTHRGALVLLGGQLTGTVPASSSGATGTRGSRAGTPVGIVTGSGTTEVASTGGKPAEFSVSVNPDKSSTFSLFSGTAQVTAEGRTVTLKPNQTVTVDPSSPPGAPARIAETPELLAPAESAVASYSSASPRIEFRWSDTSAERYHLVVARDPNFQRILCDERPRAPRFSHGNLAAGRYYWRVSGTLGRSDGRPSQARSFTIEKDDKPPTLTVDLPREVTGVRTLVVRGVTEPGSEVIVANSPVPVSADGRFEHTVELKPGMNMIVVEAVDGAGNSAYRSQYVNAKFQDQRTSIP